MSARGHRLRLAAGGPRPTSDLARSRSHVGVTGAAGQAQLDGPATVRVDDLPGRPARGVVTVAPLDHGHEHGNQIAALVGEKVLMADRAILVDAALEYAIVGEPAEAVGEHIAGDVEAGLEVAEAGDSGEEGIADDEQRPPVAGDLEGPSDRAVLIGVVTRQHTITIPKRELLDPTDSVRTSVG